MIVSGREHDCRAVIQMMLNLISGARDARAAWKVERIINNKIKENRDKRE